MPATVFAFAHIVAVLMGIVLAEIGLSVGGSLLLSALDGNLSGPCRLDALTWLKITVFLIVTIGLGLLLIVGV